MTSATLKVLLWLMMINPGVLGLCVAAGGAVTFGMHFFLPVPSTNLRLLERGGESSKDEAQDEHMRNTDREIDRIQAERDERRKEGLEHRALQDAEIKELSDAIHNIYGYGGGAFAMLTVFQIIGLLKKIGPQGSQGAQGREGIQGRQGDRGERGERGDRGYSNQGDR